MAGFITNYIQNTAASLLTTGITAAGTVAGNAVGGVGTLVESAGRAAGNKVDGGIAGVGNAINARGQMIMDWTAPNPAQGSVVQKTAVKAKPSSGGAKKAVGGTSQKAISSAPYSSAYPQTKTAASKPKPALGPNQKTISAASKPKPSGAGPSSSAKSVPKQGAVNNSGKVAISAASRPKAKK